MDYALLLYLVFSVAACASLVAVFYLAYYPHSSQPLRRWFLVVLANTAAAAALAALLLGPRLGASPEVRRVVQLSRSVLVCLNAFVVPYFVHAYLPPAIGGPASAGAAAAAFAAAILEIAELPRVAGTVLGVILLYSFLLCVAMAVRLRRRFPSHPDAWVLRTVLIVAAFFLPGLLLQVASGYRILVWKAASSLLRFELTPVCLAVISFAVLLRLRSRSPGVAANAVAGARGAAGAATSLVDTPAGPAADGAIHLPERLLAELSQREREVVDKVLEGHTNREISDALFIAESTVKKHVNSAFRKLHVGSRWQLLKLQKGGE